MSVYKYTLKSGKHYGARFRCDENGAIVQKNLRGFRTMADAKLAEAEYKIAANKAVTILSEPAPSALFSEVWENYKAYAVGNLAPSSVYDYTKIIELYILPDLGGTRIASISRKQLIAWQDKLPADLSYKYKTKIRTTLSAVLTYAVNREYIEVSPLSRVERIRNRSQACKISFWTKQEFEMFIAAVKDEMYRAFFTFLYLSGCRKGEAFALLWADFDFEKRTVSITKGITKKGAIMAAALGKENPQRTKNGKTGVIYMPKSCMTLIAALPRETYVFGGDKPLAESTVSRVFKKAIAQSGVKRIRMHDLRHSSAALIISLSSESAGELSTLYALADRLRDTVEQVLHTYGHLFPSRQASIMKTLDEHFG